MSNFDFLKNFNKELYKLGNKLENDVLESPRAVTADATLFLEELVKDIYRQANLKLENRLVSFYKKIDYLYRQGTITYIYKNKLQDAYNLRNKIHKNYQDTKEEQNLAFDLHKRLYYIAKKYYRDYNENERYTTIPEYTKPVKKDIKFNNCIICGVENTQSPSNMCDECNQKIENANLMLTLKNTYDKTSFTRQDLIRMGMSESETISLLMRLTKDNIINKKYNKYSFNEENFNNYIAKINQYIEIGLLITKYYKDEITAEEIKKSMAYWKGSKHQKPCIEFYKLVNQKIIRDFEDNLIKTEDIKKSIKNSSIDNATIKEWFKKEEEQFIKGSLNDAFILYNEIQIREFFELKRKGMEDKEILAHLQITPETYDFWQEHFMGEDFMKKTSEIKKDMIIKEIRKNKTLNEALKSAGTSRKEFNKLYIISKNTNGSFYNEFKKEYAIKRQKSLIKHLKHNNLNSAIRKSKITRTEFLKWYYKSEANLSSFYIEVSKILMGKYLIHRKNGWNKKNILKHINISKDMFDSWLKHDDVKVFHDFKTQNRELTSYLVKRGIIINSLKDDKCKAEAIASAGLTPREFLEIYNTSKKEKTEFYIRFDKEYMENRKRLFSKLIRENDFYNTIEKCEISQIDFNKWFLKDQDKYLSDYYATDFYSTVTSELMSKYIKARLNGKNKPDAARSVGLSNMIITKWLNHAEYEIYYEFKKKIKQLTIDLIVKGFSEGKSKMEVSQDYDVPMKTIEDYIDLGRNNFMKYEKLFRLYEEKIIPNQLDEFLKSIETKTFAKSLKNAKISEDDLKYYYDYGRTHEESRFNDFYSKYSALKIRLYVNNILDKKSHKVALKNSNLSIEEYNNNLNEIEEEVLYGRMCIIGEFLVSHKTNGAKLANLAGITVEEFYEWYFKGRQGDEDYRNFYMMIELGLVYPRVEAYKKAIKIGIPRNWLCKKIKKDLGAADYRIWEKHGILNEDYFSQLDFDDEDVDMEKIIKIIKNNPHSVIADKDKEPELYNMVHKMLIANDNRANNIVNLSNNVKISKKEIIGK